MTSISKKQIFTLCVSVAIGFWLVLMSFQMITDTWDESNALLMFESMGGQGDFFSTLALIWSQEVGNLYRPIPVSFGFVVYSVVGDYYVAWLSLRLANVVFLFASLFFLLRSVRIIAGSNYYRDMGFVLLFLCSGSVIISAAWFANIFDASALFFISLGLFCLLKGRFFVPVVCFSAAFFCKEISVLVFFVLALLWREGFVSKARAMRLLVVLSVVLLVYFILRQSVVPLGSSQDVHGFELNRLLPTVSGWFESFWWQNTRRSEGVFGVVVFVAFLFSLRSYFAQGFVVLTSLCCIVVYWGMFPYVEGEVITALVFQGRLYLLPVAFVLFVGAIWGRSWSYPVICVPVILGGYSTYMGSYQFQKTYQAIYHVALVNKGRPVYVHYPGKPLSDSNRQVFIGNYPDAQYRIVTASGKLEKQ